MQETPKQDSKKFTTAGSYEAPAIIFETIISTRAGSPISNTDVPSPPDQDNGIDLFPAD